MTDDARIRDRMLMNLFAVFNERDPERRAKAIAANYTEDVIWSDPETTFDVALMRDGRIAVLYALVNTGG
jgi:hypothetical protein